MDVDDAYCLLDAGDGRRLERFGPRVVDRPSSSASGPRDPQAGWSSADLRFDRAAGWQTDHGAISRALSAPWTIGLDGLTLELRPATGGQVGIFPEHQPGWRWVAQCVRDRCRAASRGPRVLNLFGYTGATSLAAACAGAAVAHVDGSRAAVAWARRNAVLSGSTDLPIRWLVDDAAAFVGRELRRGARYDGIILDPPSYGHGGRRAWRLGEDLPALLAGCAGLLDRTAPFVLLSSHTRGYDGTRLAGLIARAFDVTAGHIEASALEVRAATGARLALGASARWSS